MNKLSNFGAWEDYAGRFKPLRPLLAWLNAMPHPAVAVEFAQTHIAAGRWDSRTNKLEAHAVELLPEGAIQPSPVEANITNMDAVQSALSVVLGHISAESGEVALLVPDPVVRVFILPFETFPHNPEEGISMLRWRLKKSVPFDVEETIVSSMRQTGRGGGLEIVAALARQRVLTEYEGLAQGAGLEPGVVLSSSLATLSLLDETGATLLARVSGRHLSTVIVNGASLCVYRSGEMVGELSAANLQTIMEEIFPGVAYFQDTWGGNIERARLAGFGARESEMSELLQRELNCNVVPLVNSAADFKLPPEMAGLLGQNLESLAGWAMDRGA